MRRRYTPSTKNRTLYKQLPILPRPTLHRPNRPLTARGFRCHTGGQTYTDRSGNRTRGSYNDGRYPYRHHSSTEQFTVTLRVFQLANRLPTHGRTRRRYSTRHDVPRPSQANSTRTTFRINPRTRVRTPTGNRYHSCGGGGYRW